MKHQSVAELKVVAEIGHRYPKAMSRTDRLERWAECLEILPNSRLSTLRQTEYQPFPLREEMRSDDTPISVAFRDPVLRAAGMQNDTYGEAKRFFELSDGQLHDVVCHCHFGESVSAAAAARNIRGIMSGKGPGLFARLRDAFMG